MGTPGVRRRRGRRFVLITVVSLLVLAVGGAFGVGWYYSGQLLDPANAHPGLPDTALGAAGTPDKPTVLLAESDNTKMPGTWGLVWGGGAARVGDVVSRSGGRVERAMLDGTPPAPNTKVRLETSVWTTDPKVAFGLGFDEVSVRTELGDAPAWFVPATRTDTTWAIAVHGRGGSRTETLRALPQLHEAGLPVLSVTYRNDLGAPASPDGLFHLGDTEWHDLEAAVRYAQDKGATHVLLYGWSMGGAIVGQFLARSPLAGSVSAVVLDAPVTSWTKTLDLQAANRGLPSALTPVAELVSDWRADLDFDRFDLVANPPATKPPTLLFHGTADGTVPVQASRDLAAAADRLHWPLRYVEVPGAAHTAAWNVDQDGYRRNLGDFLTSTIGAPTTAH
ncbi:prolyl oligopeptidase family serine peptidase [Solihabitans fulvus]|uniref:Prolyl oligopeptidase family serine peptidase n=1 Tax=Solihabitans fulvus TaxID=1892852 RepID=A0A5B2X013_9PSEU|nr:prolyl oligopeptidase family serine peptidase [Solihabitans fulvus]KAA2255637.1 prolyl oligopeptidase family serine peptidase [Solihabitans fulvus]